MRQPPRIGSEKKRELLDEIEGRLSKCWAKLKRRNAPTLFSKILVPLAAARAADEDARFQSQVAECHEALDELEKRLGLAR